MAKTLNQTQTLSENGYSSGTDEDLLLHYRASGDRSAFDRLVHRYERELYNYLRRYTGDAELAEDAFQNTFLQLHLKCQQFEAGARLRPWLYTIATHQAIDAMRKASRHRMMSLDQARPSVNEELGTLGAVLAGSEAAPSHHLEEAEKQTWIRQAVGHLPDHLRSVVLLAYYQGLKYREIAETLKLPVGTVKSRLHAAIKKLHHTWNQSELSGDR